MATITQMGEQVNLTYCPVCGTGSIPSHDGIFQRIFSRAYRTLPTRPEPVWQKMAQSPLNDTTQPDTQEIGRSSTMDRRWLKQMKDLSRWNPKLIYFLFNLNLIRLSAHSNPSCNKSWIVHERNRLEQYANEMKTMHPSDFHGVLYVPYVP